MKPRDRRDPVYDIYDFSVSNLQLPDAESAELLDRKTGATTIVRRWKPHEVLGWLEDKYEEGRKKYGALDHMYLYQASFSLTVQLIEGNRPVGKPTKIKDIVGGRKQMGAHATREWHRVEFE